jgi:thiamine kinase-like enzyme
VVRGSGRKHGAVIGKGLDVLDRLACLSGQPRTVSALPGGLTNRNFHVVTPAGRYVARVAIDGTELLGIDRDCEYRNSVAAAQAGVGAPVVEYLPAEKVLVVGFIDGRTLDNEDVAANISRVAQACRALHGGPRFGNDFSAFGMQRRYLATATGKGFRIPDGYDRLAERFATVERALDAGGAAGGTVPCNNDLLAANFIDDGERLRLIDYEYSGNNDPCFELGNIWAECQLSDEGLAELVTCYYGRNRRSKTARARLLGLAGKYCWTLWGSIQHAISPIDFDFWSWAMERFDGAAAGIGAAGYNQMLEDLQLDD